MKVRYLLFLDSSMVEHSAVNRVVVGSSPTRGAGHDTNDSVHVARSESRILLRPLGQAVKTSPFHGGNSSPNLLGVIIWRHGQAVRHGSAKPLSPVRFRVSPSTPNHKIRSFSFSVFNSESCYSEFFLYLNSGSCYRSFSYI